MISLDDEFATHYLTECCEHLETMETNFLDIEKGGVDIDEERINQAFRAVHSIKAGAGFFNLVSIGELAHQTESVLALIRSREMVPTPDRIGVLLNATDRLMELLRNPRTSNQADITEIMSCLARLPAEQPASAENGYASTDDQVPQSGHRLRTLLVEDDFVSRLLLQTFLSRHGECHVAVNGKEAVEAFGSALQSGLKYDLVCMDIMMPEMDGREAVRRVRALEESRGILSSSGAKIIMITALTEIKDVSRCYQELCDSYLVKPIDLAELLSQMRSYQLVP